jgi:hypothetical protein
MFHLVPYLDVRENVLLSPVDIPEFCPLCVIPYTDLFALTPIPVDLAGTLS